MAKQIDLVISPEVQKTNYLFTDLGSKDQGYFFNPGKTISSFLTGKHPLLAIQDSPEEASFGRLIIPEPGKAYIKDENGNLHIVVTANAMLTPCIQVLSDNKSYLEFAWFDDNKPRWSRRSLVKKILEGTELPRDIGKMTRGGSEIVYTPSKITSLIVGSPSMVAEHLRAHILEKLSWYSTPKGAHYNRPRPELPKPISLTEQRRA